MRINLARVRFILVAEFGFFLAKQLYTLSKICMAACRRILDWLEGYADGI